MNNKKVTKKVKIEIEGMTCASCAAHVTKELGKLSAKNINVNPISNKAILEVSENTTKKQLADSIKNAGYKPIKIYFEGEKVSSSEEKIDESSKWKNKLIGAWIFTLPLAALMYVPLGVSMNLMYYLMLAFAFPVIFIFGFNTIKSGLKGFFKLKFTMDSLIMLGTVIAFSTGILSLFVEVENYSGVSGMIMAIFITGKYIEAVSKGKATKEIKKLLEIGAKNATVIRNKKEIEIPIEEVLVGDIILVKSGQKIPVDGIVLSGESTVNESMITGESFPVKKSKNDLVIGATINQNGVLEIKATKIGKDSFLSNIIKLVEEAQGTKIPIQRVADKVTGIFVPVILVITLFTLLGWLIGTNMDWGVSIGVAISVLVIACPCALGLAVPISLTVGSGIGAKRGILIRKGEAIQTMKEIKIICFDKTGTITNGKPEVADIFTNKKVKEEYFLKIAASMEKNSEHPLGKSILEKEQTKKYFSVKNFKTIQGKGLQASINNKKILLGNVRLLEENKINLENYKDKINAFQDKGESIVLVSEGKELLGILGIRDELKKDSRKAIHILNKSGYKTVMITGDNDRTAKAIAKEVGIKEVISEVLPEEKLNVVKDLQKRGFVAFVGDGINDAPALKQANVGIAIGSGSDIAIESGDIVLVKGNPLGIVKSIKLSKKTFSKIKQNLFWAFFYNVAMIPLAISGSINPVLAEIAMAFSSISVVVNANLLRKIKL